jgi:Zn-dependent protease
MDLLATVILPLMAIVFNTPVFFGWAKPVPVNARNLKSPRKDMFWVALVGPLSNIFLAFVGAAIIWGLVHFVTFTPLVETTVKILMTFMTTNLFLAVFNLIPLNPLDGGKVLARFLPAQMNYKLEQNEHITSMILMALVLTGALGILAGPVRWGMSLLMLGTGLGGLS